jgi:hypothetical protein
MASIAVTIVVKACQECTAIDTHTLSLDGLTGDGSAFAVHLPNQTLEPRIQHYYSGVPIDATRSVVVEPSGKVWLAGRDAMIRSYF